MASPIQLNITDAQYIGDRLKVILDYLWNCPAGATIARLQRKFPGDCDNLAFYLEMAIAADWIEKRWAEDEEEGHIQKYLYLA